MMACTTSPRNVGEISVVRNYPHERTRPRRGAVCPAGTPGAAEPRLAGNDALRLSLHGQPGAAPGGAPAAHGPDDRDSSLAARNACRAGHGRWRPRGVDRPARPRDRRCAALPARRRIRGGLVPHAPGGGGEAGANRPRAGIAPGLPPCAGAPLSCCGRRHYDCLPLAHPGIWRRSRACGRRRRLRRGRTDHSPGGLGP
jgi:hypothetical protein